MLQRWIKDDPGGRGVYVAVYSRSIARVLFSSPAEHMDVRRMFVV